MTISPICADTAGAASGPGCKHGESRRSVPLSAEATRDRRLLGALRPILRSTSVATLYAGGVERSAHDVVPNARQILYSPSAHQHHRMLLKRVTDPRDVGVHLASVRQSHACDLAKRRIGFLGRARKDAQTHAPALRRAHQVGRLGALLIEHPTPTHQLLDRRHDFVDLSARPQGRMDGRDARRLFHAKAQTRASPCTAPRRRRDRRKRPRVGSPPLRERTAEIAALCPKTVAF